MRARLMMAAAVGIVAACGGGEREKSDAAKAPRNDTAATAGTSTQGGAVAAVSGQAVYNRICITCHQANGRGQPGAFPPLVGSDFVTGDPSAMIKIVLNGMTGPVTVAGQRFNGVMPPWKGQLNDAEVAAVISYVRRTFGNATDSVTMATVRGVRAETASRATPYTAAELGHN